MGLRSPCVFWNQRRNARAVVHGDDFTIFVDGQTIEWFQNDRRFWAKNANNYILTKYYLDLCYLMITMSFKIAWVL